MQENSTINAFILTPTEAGTESQVEYSIHPPLPHVLQQLLQVYDDR